jgi:hypothetical protein
MYVCFDAISFLLAIRETVFLGACISLRMTSQKLISDRCRMPDTFSKLVYDRCDAEPLSTSSYSFQRDVARRHAT